MTKIKYGKGKGESHKQDKKFRDGEKFLRGMQAPTLKGSLK